MKNGPKKRRFVPLNPQKYMGNVKNIISRSNWEYQLMKEFDTNPQITAWASEEISIPYACPLAKKRRKLLIRKYYPDFLVKNDKGEMFLIEVKPHHQTMRPEKKTKVTKRHIKELSTWMINQEKWKAAKALCEEKGWTWQIITEKDVGFFR